MSDQHSATIKYKKNKKRINIGLIICIIIILYFVTYFYDFLLHHSNHFYEVTQGSTSSLLDGQYSALIIRSETVVNSGSSGYVNYFVGDETPVYVGEQAYLIDKSGELSAKLKQAAQTQALLNENDLTQIKDSLNHFQTSFRINDYYEAYHFKYQLESQILDLVNSSVFEDNTYLYAGSYDIYTSDLAGIVMHYTDGLEGCTLDSFDASAFRKSSYHKQIIKSNDYVEAGSPVYKVLTSEDWYLIIQVNNPEAFQDMNVISIDFLKDNISATANFELLARGGNYYGIISLNKYMIRYASERYAQIAFTDDTYTGLKIPKSSVAERTFYAIPSEYLTRGSNTSAQGFAVLITDENGSESAEMRYPEILKENNGLCYIAVDDPLLTYGDTIIKTDSSNEFQVGMTASLQGAYTDNNGIGTFHFVEILGENNGYYIISENTSDGIRLFDQVYVDYKDAEKND